MTLIDLINELQRMHALHPDCATNEVWVIEEGDNPPLSSVCYDPEEHRIYLVLAP